MTQVAVLIDTGAGPSLVSKAFLHSTCISLSRTERINFLKLGSANKQPLSSKGAVLLHLQMDVLRIRLWFELADNLAEDLLLGTSFVDKYIREVFLAERKLFLWYSQPATVIEPATKIHDAVTRANHIDNLPPSSPVADEIYHKAVDAKVAAMAPHAHTSVLA